MPIDCCNPLFVIVKPGFQDPPVIFSQESRRYAIKAYISGCGEIYFVKIK